MARKAKNTTKNTQAAKKAKRKKQASQADQPMDAMSRCAALCQEKRWREALMLCRRICEKADKEGNADSFVALSGAQAKIEFSLRRQMAATLMNEARQMLAKEYLLDVGE